MAGRLFYVGSNMKWLAPAIILSLVSCTYYGSHKILNFGEEPEQRYSYEDQKKQLEVEMSPGPMYWPYVEGAQREVMGYVKVRTTDVPTRVTIDAIGHNAEVGNVTVLARYISGPEHAQNSYSDVLARDNNMKQIASDGGQQMFEFRGLFNHQPRKPYQIEVWFKIYTHFKSSADVADIGVSFNGARVGGYRIDYSQAAPKDYTK